MNVYHYCTTENLLKFLNVYFIPQVDMMHEEKRKYRIAGKSKTKFL